LRRRRRSSSRPRLCACRRPVGDHQRRSVRRGRGLREAALVCSLAETCHSVPAPPAAKPPASAGGCTKSWPTSSGQWRRSTKFDASTWPKRCCSPWWRVCRSRTPSPQPWRRHAADLSGGGVTSRYGEETHEQQPQRPQHQRGRGRRKRPCSGAGHLDAAREVNGVAPTKPCLVAHAAARAAVRPRG
jgi:hypothetical protein